MPELAGSSCGRLRRRSSRELEEDALSPLAVRSYETRGREREEECGVRTPFQRDRDRIVHSKPFRRLKGKTQVFIDPAGDHYRTRMTHTLETTGIARVVARALRLNEDLAEAIGLGHDTATRRSGTPARRRSTGAAQRRRRVPPQRAVGAHREAAEPDARGRSTGSSRTPVTASPRRSRERSCAIVDRVAYINHDIDDAIRYGILAESRPAGRGDRHPRPDRRAADRHARPRSRRAVGRRRRHRPGRRDRRARCSRSARSCSSASTSGRRRGRSTSARERAIGGSSSTLRREATTRGRSPSSSRG